MEYIILSDTLMNDLQKQVNTYLKMGWKIEGGLAFNMNTKQVMQAMSK
jgi:hypothetical protein